MFEHCSSVLKCMLCISWVLTWAISDTLKQNSCCVDHLTTHPRLTQLSSAIHIFCLVVDLPLWKMMDFVSWDDDVPNIWEKCSKPSTSYVMQYVTVFLPKRVTSDTQLESKPGTLDFMNKTPVNDDSCAKPNSTVNLQFWREFFPSISDLEISWGLFTSGFTLFKLDEPNFIPFPECCSCPISRLGETLCFATVS